MFFTGIRSIQIEKGGNPRGVWGWGGERDVVNVKRVLGNFTIPQHIEFLY
jgi:hypothetical protein